MAIGWDEANPTDNAIVSQYPNNERNQRAVQASAWALEHDDNEGRHSFVVGNTAARDAITSWTSGALFINTSAGDGNTVIQVFVSSGQWEETGRFNSADEAKLDAVISAASATSAEAAAGTETGIRMWSPAIVAAAVSALPVSSYVAATVNQAALKTTTGDLTWSNATNMQTGPGGEFGFWPTIKENAAVARRHVLTILGHENNAGTDTDTDVTVGTSFLQRFFASSNATPLTMRQRYIQASPPYFLGVTQVPTFIFALIENATGKILNMYQAADPPWANNGPTNIRCHRVDKKGVGFKTIRVRNPKAKAEDLDFWVEREIEVTADYKNSDMGLIPHPYIGNNLKGKTVVMIDPRMKLVERLHEMIETGDEPLKLFHDGDIKIDNTDIPNVVRPMGVNVMSAVLR